jgi:hypothetical protein
MGRGTGVTSGWFLVFLHPSEATTKVSPTAFLITWNVQVAKKTGFLQFQPFLSTSALFITLETGLIILKPTCFTFRFSLQTVPITFQVAFNPTRIFLQRVVGRVQVLIVF